MGKFLAAALGAVLGGIALPGADAAPDPACMKDAAMTAYLAQRYNETPVWIGLRAAEFYVVYIEQNSGTSWTLVKVTNGQACLVEVGLGYSFKPNTRDY